LAGDLVSFGKSRYRLECRILDGEPSCACEFRSSLRQRLDWALWSQRQMPLMLAAGIRMATAYIRPMSFR
jgi:hypothetical protein